MCQLTGVKLLMLWVMEKVLVPAVCDFPSTLGKVTAEEKCMWNWSFRNVEENVWCLQIHSFFYLDVAEYINKKPNWTTKLGWVFFLFINCKCRASGPAKICSGCLGCRLHHFCWCFLLLFPTVKIATWFAQAEMFYRVCFLGGNTLFFCGTAMLTTWLFSDQRWVFELQCDSLHDDFTFCTHHQLHSFQNNNR